MKKYAQVQEVISRLTEDPVFRTFFTLYLMAPSETDRQLLNDRFWEAAKSLSKAEQGLLRAELTQCFRRLPALAAESVTRASSTAATS